MALETMIAEGDGFYFYRESFDEDQVFLRLSGDLEYTATAKSVTMKIPTHIWEFIRQTGAARIDLAEKSDDELLEIVEAEIAEKRIELELKECAKGQKEAEQSNYFTVISSLRYAGSNEPHAEQIKQGLARCRNERTRQQEVLRKMREYRAAEEES